MFHRQVLPTIAFPLTIKQEIDQHRHTYTSLAPFAFRNKQQRGFKPINNLYLKRQTCHLDNKPKFQNTSLSNKLLRLKATWLNETKHAVKAHQLLNIVDQNTLNRQNIVAEKNKLGVNNASETIANSFINQVSNKNILNQIKYSYKKYRNLKLYKLDLQSKQHKKGIYSKGLTPFKKNVIKFQKNSVLKDKFRKTKQNQTFTQEFEGWKDLQSTFEQDFVNLY